MSSLQAYTLLVEERKKLDKTRGYLYQMTNQRFLNIINTLEYLNSELTPSGDPTGYNRLLALKHKLTVNRGQDYLLRNRDWLDVISAIKYNIGELDASANESYQTLLEFEKRLLENRELNLFIKNNDVIIFTDTIEWMILNGLDELVSAFISAYSISDSTEIAALSGAIAGFRGTGTTNGTDFITADLLYAFYPLSPTSLAAAQGNLITPGTFDITWFNSPIHSANGVAGDGVGAYGDTGFVPSTDGNKDDFGLSFSTSTSTELGSTDIDFGATDGNITNLAVRNSNQLSWRNANNITQIANADAAGIWTGTTRSSTDNEIYKNGSSIASSASPTGTATAVPLFVMARNNSGVASFFTDRVYQCFAIHKGFTDEQAKDFSDVVQAYNTALSR